jgi:hypothetical protein
MGSLINRITGKFNRKYVDTDLQALVEPFSVEILCVRSATDKIAIDLNNCRWTDYTKQQLTLGENIENIDFAFKAAEIIVTATDSTICYA